MKTVSIIIPIYNAEKFLPELFSCLKCFCFRDGDEVLLVDNGSTDASKSMCLEYAKENKQCRVLEFFEVADSYAARNYAVKNAKGCILAFTDSDCKPLPSWLDEVRKTEEGFVTAGMVELEVVANGLWEHFDRHVHLGQTENAIKNNCVPTANMAVNASDFHKVGYFEERFSGGDFEWSMRACRKGLVVNYNPKAFMYHPSRKTFEEIATRERRTAYGQGKSYKNQNKSKGRLIAKFVLKIFKIDTNLVLTIKLAKSGVKLKELFCFNYKFFHIRILQLKAAIAGYNQENARKLEIR